MGLAGYERLDSFSDYADFRTLYSPLCIAFDRPSPPQFYLLSRYARMRSLISHFILTVTLLGSVIGCSMMQPRDLLISDESEYLPSAEHGVQLDAQQIPSYGDAQRELEGIKLTAATTTLTAAESACRAAAQSQMAAVLEKEAANVRRELNRHKRRGPSELLPGILMDRAAEERNHAAEQALVAYYQLAEIHLQNAVLAEGYAELDRVRQAVTGLLTAGFVGDMDLSELDRRRADLNRQSADLVVNEAKVTVQVKTLIGEDPFSLGAIETSCSIEPRPVGYELPEAMEIARSNDFELKSIDRLLRHGTAGDLDVARSLLQVASPLLGQAPAALGFFAKIGAVLRHSDNDETEMRTRKQQLRKLREARQQQLDLEVANLVVSVQRRFAETAITNDILTSWDDRVGALASQRELRKSDYQDLVHARGERLKARSAVLHSLILLEIEHAKLRGRMGLLGQECGYGSTSGGKPVEPVPMPCLPSHGPCRVLGPMLRN